MPQRTGNRVILSGKLIRHDQTKTFDDVRMSWLPYTNQQKMAHDFDKGFESACVSILFICDLNRVSCSLHNAMIDTSILHVRPFRARKASLSTISSYAMVPCHQVVTP